jgi:hypothetical protein
VGAGLQHVGMRRSFEVVLDDGLCQTCNNVRLSELENAVKPILATMAVEPRPTAAGLQEGRLGQARHLGRQALLQLHPGLRAA